MRRWAAEELRSRYGSDHLTIRQIAEAAEIKPNTWSQYVANRRAPRADRRYERTPLWSVETIAAWMASRPGVVGRPRGSRPVQGGRSAEEEVEGA